MRCAMSDQTSDRYNASGGRRGFPFQDILWAVGIFATIFGLTPVIVFYLLVMN